METLDVVVSLACVVAFVVALVVWGVQAAEGRKLKRIARLVSSDRVAEALAAPLPRGESREQALVLQATAALSGGDLPEAERLVEEAARGGALDGGTLLVARLVKARVLAARGRYPELAAFLGDDPEDQQLRDARAGAAIERGEAELAERLLGGPRDPGPHELGRLQALATLRLRQGAYADAQALLDSAPPVDGGESALTALRAVVALRSGDLAAAGTLSESVLASLQSGPRPPVSRVGPLLVAAEVAARLGSVDRARAHLAEVTGILAGLDLPALHARVPAVEAEIAVAAGDTGLARTRLAEALEVHQQMGAVLEPERISRRLAELAPA